jgi:hypothetical protein
MIDMREKSTTQPLDKHRIVKAFFLAPLAVAPITAFLWVAIMTISDDNVRIAEALLAIGFLALAVTIVAYIHEVLIWLPTFLFLRKRHEITKRVSIKYGGLIGAIPVLLYTITTTLSHADALPVILIATTIFSLNGAAMGYMFWRIGIKPVDSK